MQQGRQPTREDFLGLTFTLQKVQQLEQDHHRGIAAAAPSAERQEFLRETQRLQAEKRTAQQLGAIGISVEREAARLEHQRLLAAAREEAIQRLTPIVGAETARWRATTVMVAPRPGTRSAATRRKSCGRVRKPRRARPKRPGSASSERSRRAWIVAWTAKLPRTRRFTVGTTRKECPRGNRSATNRPARSRTARWRRHDNDSSTGSRIPRSGRARACRRSRWHLAGQHLSRLRLRCALQDRPQRLLETRPGTPQPRDRPGDCADGCRGTSAGPAEGGRQGDTDRRDGRPGETARARHRPRSITRQARRTK